MSFIPFSSVLIFEYFEVSWPEVHSKTLLTTVHEHQLSSLYVILGEVQDLSGGGPLQGQVSVAWWCDDELQSLRLRSVRILCTQIVCGDFCH